MLLTILATASAFAAIHVTIGVWARYFVFVSPALAIGMGVALALALAPAALGSGRRRRRAGLLCRRHRRLLVRRRRPRQPLAVPVVVSRQSSVVSGPSVRSAAPRTPHAPTARPHPADRRPRADCPAATTAQGRVLGGPDINEPPPPARPPPPRRLPSYPPTRLRPSPARRHRRPHRQVRSVSGRAHPAPRAGAIGGAKWRFRETNRPQPTRDRGAPPRKTAPAMIQENGPNDPQIPPIPPSSRRPPARIASWCVAPRRAPSIGSYSPPSPSIERGRAAGVGVRAPRAPTTAGRHSGHSHLSPTDSRLPTPDSRLV